MPCASRVYQWDLRGREGTAELLLVFFNLIFIFTGFFFILSRNPYVQNDESNSSSIIFAEFTSEKEKSSGEAGTDSQNNRLVNYGTSLITRDSREFESSSLLQGNDLADLPSGSIIEHQLPLRHHSDLEGNFTSTGESSENLSLSGQTEVDHFPRTCWWFDAHP